MNNTSNMAILQHLGELRTRIFRCFIVIAVLATISYSFSDWLFALFVDPFHAQFANGALIGTGPAEAFVLKIKVACFAGVILGAPYIFHQFWLFVAPGLYESERRLLLPFVFFSTMLFLAGIAFSYYFVLPVIYDFFYSQYQSIKIVPNIRMTEHLSTIIKLMLAFAFVFEVPVISVLLAKLGILTSKAMTSSWRYIVVACFVIGAVLTPPDVVSQMLLAGPMLVLYVVSIGLVKLVERTNPAEESASTEEKA